jgi:hypothetical protein
MSRDLVAWLRLQCDLDERDAPAASTRPLVRPPTSEVFTVAGEVMVVYGTGWPKEDEAARLAAAYRQRILDEVAAKRAVLDKYDLIVRAAQEAGQPSDRYDYRNDYLGNVVRITVHADQQYAHDMVKQVLYAVIVDLAYPYRHMPGWQEAWAA